MLFFFFQIACKILAMLRPDCSKVQEVSFVIVSPLDLGFYIMIVFLDNNLRQLLDVFFDKNNGTKVK